MTFPGFSTDNLVSLPPELFTLVLPAITLPGEAKVTLHIFYRLSQQRGSPRRIRWDDLAHDEILLRGLRSISRLRPPHEMLDEGLDAAIQRGTLLHLAAPEARRESRVINWYLVNTAANREWVEQARRLHIALAPTSPVPAEQPTLLTLYEQNIGLVTPLLLEELRDAEAQYPQEWLEEAIREAVRANARSWRYIRKVLERWAINGRQDAPNQTRRWAEQPIDAERYVSGPYGHLFQRGGKRRDTEQ